MNARTPSRGAAALLFGLALLVLAPPARATEGPRVGVRLQSYTPPAFPGGPATFEVRLEAREAIAVSGLRASGGEGRRVDVTSTQSAGPLLVPRGEQRVLRFTATGEAAEGQVVLDFLANGLPVRKGFDFSRANREKHLHAGRLHSVPDAGSPAEVAAVTTAVTDPAPLKARPATKHAVRMRPGADARGVAPQSAQGRIVRVRGSLKYQRDDGVTLGADAVTFRIYDEDDLSDDLEYVGTTSTNGSFDVTISFEEDEPDIYVEFETSNSHVTVEDASFWENNYVYETIRHTDYTGSDLAFGTLMPDESDYPVLHIFTNIQRAWRWWAQNRSNTVEPLECQYPEQTWPHYDGEIHIPYSSEGEPFRWMSATHVHEYGHHLKHQFMYSGSTNYDNDICNREDGSPGHCVWCEETGFVAVNEGWPNWYAGHVLSQYASLYSVAANHTRDTEHLSDCRDSNGNSCPCDPYRTEGHFGVVFKDLVDDTPGENDPLSGEDYYFDRIDLTVDDALDVLSMPNVLSTQQFVDAIRAAHPEVPSSDWWSTLNNAGFHSPDTNPPSFSGLFWCPSHSTQSASPRAFLTLQWQPATDQESGVAGYLIHVGETKVAPQWGDDLVGSQATTFDSDFLTAGHSYYASIRAFDQEDNLGNWKWVGPFEIRAPEPPDMMATTPGSTWYRPLVARDAGDESGGAQPTASLPGNVADTWLNVYARNHGELSASTIEAHLRVDGQAVDSIAAGSFSVVQGKGFLNLGPYTVRGGRHALQVYWDSDARYSEADERDNLYTTQYTWLPTTLASNIPYTRPAPPARDAGRSTMDPSQSFYWNVDGYRFKHRTSPLSPISSWWSAVTLAQVNWEDDDDLQLYDTSDLSGVGFDIARARSSRAEGLLDAVFSNRRAHTTDAWDVGVVNADSGNGSYRLRHVTSSAVALGDSVSVTQGANVLLSLRELAIGAGESGTIEVVASVTRGAPDLYALRFDPSFEKGGILDYAQKVSANDDGVIRMTFAATANTTVPLAFYRNPGTSPAESTVVFTLQVRRLLPDLVVDPPSNWYAPLIPRSSLAVITFGLNAPTSLEGDDGPTYLNWSYVNNSLSGFSTYVPGRVRHDLTTLASPTLFGDVAPGQRFTVSNSGPYTLAGGRHVLSLGLDWTGALGEDDEGNNLWAEQWVWTPDTLAFGVGAWRRGTNGMRNTLWSSLSAGEPAWPNADGVRTELPTTPTRWFGAAVLPGARSDVDLFVHERATGAKDGFEDFLASSEWGQGALDYVLWDAGATPRRMFDLGLVRANADTSSYVVQPERATTWASLGGSHAGAISAGDVFDLHEFDLPAGIHRFDLTPTAGGVDVGMALHAPGAVFSNRTAGDALASSWLAPGTAGESFTVTIGAAGRYALAVWKVSPAEVGTTSRYSITVTSGAVDAGSAPVAATGLRGAAPNPSARSSAIRFTLAQEYAVELDVYDMRGARVASLLHGVQPAGAHSATWDGRDASGRRCAPGVYLVRMRAGSYSGTLKLVRME